VFYDELPSFERPELPACLRTGKTFEANLSPNFSTFRLVRTNRLFPDDLKFLATGLGFRLFHSQSGSFVAASGNPEKGRGGETREYFPATAGNPKPAVQLACHQPYLKLLSDAEGAPDPADPKQQNAKGVWSVENVSRATDGRVGWNAPVRVRHVGSGKYLAVDASKPPLAVKKAEGAEEAWYSVRLVDDGELVGGGSGGGDGSLNLAEAENLVFYLTPTDAVEDAFLPRQDTGKRVTHAYLGFAPPP
jgi:hypothetical protein